MNDYLAEQYVFDACDFIEKAIEQLHEAYSECELYEDKRRISEAIYNLNLELERLSLPH